MADSVPTFKYGYVVGRFINSKGDSEDLDRLPDYVGAKLKPTFTRVRGQYVQPLDEPEFGIHGAMVYHEPVVAGVTDHGLLTGDVDPSGQPLPDATPGIWLVVGRYRVSLGSQFPSMDIEVLESHTEDAPLDLSTEQKYVPPPGVIVNTLPLPKGGEPGQVYGWTGSSVGWYTPEEGPSAYEVALRNGFSGTVDEWLESLKGVKGDPGMPDGGQPGEVLTTGEDGTAEWQALAASELADAAYDAAAGANIPVLDGSTFTVDLSKSLNVIPAITRVRYVNFSGTAPGADTYQDGMGTLLKIEGGAHNLQWPSDVTTYGTAPEFGVAFASLVVVDGVVNLIWPSSGGGGGTSVQVITRDDLVSGSVAIPPGGEAVVKLGGSSKVYVKNTEEYIYQHGSTERLRSKSLGLLSGKLEAELRGPGFIVGQSLSPDGVLVSMARIFNNGPWGTEMPEPGGGWLLAELPDTTEGRAPLNAIYDASWEVVTSQYALNPDWTLDRTKHQVWVRWLPGWSPAWSDKTADSKYALNQYWEPYPGRRETMLPQITDKNWLGYRQYAQSDLEALGWTFPGRLCTKAEMDEVFGTPPEDWTV